MGPLAYPLESAELLKASDISDAEILSSHEACLGRHGVPRWSTTWDIQDHMKQYPPKVVLAKLRSIEKRGVLRGCACGCRGDWELP